MPDAARRHRALADAGVDLALREGRLRVSPHLFNSAADIDRTLALLG
jgi:cysteine desulfurase/selenocysteine lyase